MGGIYSARSHPAGGRSLTDHRRRRPRRAVTTPTDTRRDLLTVIARMHAKPGKEQELRSALEALIEPTSREKGYVNYDLHQGIEDPGWFFFYENWESAEDLDAHLNAPHLVEFARRLDDLLDESGLVIERVRRIA
jgi:quinol monooxygenase YgiN